MIVNNILKKLIKKLLIDFIKFLAKQIPLLFFIKRFF